MFILLFDIDGTLLHTGGAGQAAMLAALAGEFGIDGPVDGIPFAGRTDRAIVGDLFARCQIDAGDGSWRRFRSAYLRHLPDALARRRGTVLPGIENLLQALAARDDVALGLLTGNLREGARLKLGHYGLADYFGFGGFGDEHLDRTDVARDALVSAQRFIRRSPRRSPAFSENPGFPSDEGRIDVGRVWVIGDTPADIRCARAVGANVLAVGSGFASMDELAAEQPDHLVADLSDPHPLLAVLR